MRQESCGVHDHIAFGVASISETEAYFAENGHPFVKETLKLDESRDTKAAYLDGDVDGFFNLFSKK